MASGAECEPRDGGPAGRPAAQPESNAVFPEPAGAAIRVSGRSTARASFSVRRGRSTMPGGMGGTTSLVVRTNSRSLGSAVCESFFEG